MTQEKLSHRQLNRATLARQMLLGRSDADIAETVAFLLGLQAQQTHDPYVALWTRLNGFTHEALTALITDRTLVRATSMRATLHLHTADDLIGIRAYVQPVIDRMWQAAFGKRFGDNDKAKVRKAGLKLLDRQTLTAGALGKALQEQFPNGEPLAKAVLMQVSETLVQIPPTRIWGSGHAPLLTRIENWLPPPYRRPIPRETLVRRYLAAFGPASVADMQAWCGMTKLGEVFTALGDELVTFRDEDGKLLYDLPDAPRPDTDTPAPIRFLPLYDNVFLGYANRRRMLSEATAHFVSMFENNKPAVLIDGTINAGWSITDSKAGATLAITCYRKLTRAETKALKAEAEAVLHFLRPEAKRHAVTIGG